MENSPVLHIEPIPAFDDNYIWLLTRAGYDGCAVVDPGDDVPVRAVLEARGLHLDAILITHKHGDHVGGVRGLKDVWPRARVYGPCHEDIAVRERPVGDGDIVDLPGLEVRLHVLEVPGHTEGHVAYHGEGILFCGDTLFAGGCGRVFGGSHEQLSTALGRIAGLSAATLVYCAHEYTLANLGFAKWVEPHNPDLLAREVRDKAKREQGLPTVPSSLADEILTNPFMRTDEPDVIAAAERWAGESLSGRTAVFRALRTWKDKDYD